MHFKNSKTPTEYAFVLEIKVINDLVIPIITLMSLNASRCHLTKGEGASSNRTSFVQIVGQKEFDMQAVVGCRTFSENTFPDKISQNSQKDLPTHEDRKIPLPSEKTPTIARNLGYLGALPFWGLSPLAYASLEAFSLSASEAGTLQIAYGATILSFLGGVHWGLAMTSITPLKSLNERFLWSVMPCLMAWPTLILPTEHGAAVQACLLGFVYFVDLSWAKRGGFPKWYMNLRRSLTVLACSGLTVTATMISTV